MKKIISLLAIIILTGCQQIKKTPELTTKKIINSHHEVMARDLMSVWTSCSNADSVSIQQYMDIVEPLVRKTGRSVVETHDEIFNLDYSYIALEQQGTAVVVLSQLTHPSCSVSRQYRINLNKVTPEGSYGVVQ